MAALLKPKNTDRMNLGGLPEYLPAYAGDFDAVINRVNSIASADGAVKADTIAPYTSGGNTAISGLKKNVTAGASSTTLTKAQSGGVFLFDAATAQTYVLPAPVVGLEYTFICTVANTGAASHEIDTDAGTTFIGGTLVCGLEATTPGANPGPKLFSGNPAASVKIATNGTTTGGLVGSMIKVTCVSSTVWMATGTMLCSGTIATPFA